MRRNEGYVAHCEHPEDSRYSRYSQLFQDFGDVRSDDFESWLQRCIDRVLFTPRERSDEDIQAVQAVQVIDHPPTPQDLADQNFLYLKVSLQYGKQDLKNSFAKELDNPRHMVKNNGRYDDELEVRYPVSGKPNIKALIKLIRVYDLRQAKPKMPLWQIGVELGLFQLEQAETTKDWKNVAAATVGRYLGKAKAIIENVGEGRFPDYRSHQER